MAVLCWGLHVLWWGPWCDSSLAMLLVGSRDMVALFLFKKCVDALCVWLFLSEGSMGWPAICDYGISWSYSLYLLIQFFFL